MYYRTQLLLLNRNCKRVSEFIFDIVQYQRCVIIGYRLIKTQDCSLEQLFSCYTTVRYCSYKVSHLYKHTHLSPIGVWLVSSTTARMHKK